MHARGKVISSVVILVMGTKLAKSEDLYYLGIIMLCKCNESVELGEKLASVCLELISTTYKCHE